MMIFKACRNQFIQNPQQARLLQKIGIFESISFSALYGFITQHSNIGSVRNTCAAQVAYMCLRA